MQARCLKAAHHGSCSSTTQEFLEAVDPEVVVISVGAENRFGHSCADVMERLELALSPSASLGINSVEGGLPIYRTDEQGVVAVITDGTRVWLETGR